jgi:hypothetical protein
VATAGIRPKQPLARSRCFNETCRSPLRGACCIFLGWLRQIRFRLHRGCDRHRPSDRAGRDSASCDHQQRGVLEHQAVSSGPVRHAYPFDTTFAVTFPTSRSGELAIAVEALGSGPQIVASGSDSVVIAPGGRTDVIVRLALVVAGDAGVPDAFAATDVGTVLDTRIADGKSSSDVLQIGTDAREPGGGGGTLGTGGRYGTGGVTSSGGVIAVGGNPFVGGTTGSTGGVVFSGGVFGTGGLSGTGGTTTFSSGALTTYTFGLGAEPCTPAKDVSGGQSGNLGTGSVCLRTADDFSGWNCNSMDDRTVKINAVSVKCGAAPPAKVGSFYYFDISAGATAWASISWFCASASVCSGSHPVPSCGHYPAWVSGGSAAPCAN